MDETLSGEPELPPPPPKQRGGRRPRVEAEADEQPRMTRAETVKRERRRRENVDKMGDLKLGVSFKLDPAYEYRWINGGVDDARLKGKTVDDDWDMVTKDGEPSDGAGAAVRRAVGESKSGFQYAYLCRKPKDLYEEDHRKRQKRDDKMMRSIREGQAQNEPGKNLSTRDHDYVHEEGIHITAR